MWPHPRSATLFVDRYDGLGGLALKTFVRPLLADRRRPRRAASQNWNLSERAPVIGQLWSESADRYGSVAPIRLIELLTYRLHQMSIRATKP